jgi:NAD(P)H dehydrogenase (quinone)
MVATNWRIGPIAITGADGQVGTALRGFLTAYPNEVRALRRDDDWAAACKDAEVIVHLAGALAPHRPNSYEAANIGTVRRTIAALQDSAVQRVVFLSFIAADPDSANPYLRAKGTAEALLRSCGIPAVIFRCDHIYGPPGDPGPTATPFLAKPGKSATVLGTGTQKLAPIFKADAVAALAHAALDPATPAGTFELAGPQTITADQFARELNGPATRIRHLSPPLARALSHVLPSLPTGAADVMLHDAIPTHQPQETAGRFGITLHTLAEAWHPDSS